MSGRPAAVLVSAVPGRLRVKAPRQDRTEAGIRRLAEALEARPGVVAVRSSSLTGSLVVEHRPQTAGVDEVRAALDELGVELREQAPAQPSGGGSVAGQVIAGVAGADGVVTRSTGFDLRTLVPLGLGALSLRQALRSGGPGLSDAPWYLMAWYAFDSFMKFHDPREQ